MGKRWGVRALEWDETNEEHIARHGVSTGEAEEVFHGPIYVRRVGRERYLVLGRTGTGRRLSLIAARASGGLVRVITARDMSEQERRLYRRRRR